MAQARRRTLTASTSMVLLSPAPGLVSFREGPRVERRPDPGARGHRRLYLPRAKEIGVPGLSDALHDLSHGRLLGDFVQNTLVPAQLFFRHDSPGRSRGH